jgi:hypothetical protein
MSQARMTFSSTARVARGRLAETGVAFERREALLTEEVQIDGVENREQTRAGTSSVSGRCAAAKCARHRMTASNAPP